MVPPMVAQPTQKSKSVLEIKPNRYPIAKDGPGLLFSSAISRGTREMYATNPRGEGGKPALNRIAERHTKYMSFFFIY